LFCPLNYFFCRGGGGSRGGRGRGAGVLNEGEISTLRRSKRNAQNSS